MLSAKITGDENSNYRRVWTKPITTYASNYNNFDVSLAPLKEHIFNIYESLLLGMYFKFQFIDSNV